MWHNEEDLMKDLVVLNDFGDPGDKESYKILYSKGRGKNLKKKSEYPETFIDSRTGETINLNEINFDMYDNVAKKGRGRGHAIRNLTKTRCQLEEQLRMARPLGSGDDAIESYCRRNKPKENLLSSESSSSSEEFSKTYLQTKDVANQKESIVKKVKATRNSSTQSNILIQTLLAKMKNEGDNVEIDTKDAVEKVAERENINILEEGEEEIKKTDESSSSVISKQISAEVVKLSEKFDKRVKKYISIIDEFENLGDIVSSCSESSEGSEERRKSSRTEYSSSNEQTKDRNEMYRNLGNRLNIPNIAQTIIGGGTHDFSPINGNEEVIEKYEITQDDTNYTFDDKDFPPLQR